MPVRIMVRFLTKKVRKVIEGGSLGGLGEGKKMSRNAKLDREREQDGVQKQIAKSNRARVRD